MVQQLNVEIKVPVTIPSDMVLIKKVEFEELQQGRLKGAYWSMSDLEKRINKNQRWIKENILMNPKFRRSLDVDFGGFVFYPEVNGEKWSFLASKMAQFLEDNFYTIFSE